MKHGTIVSVGEIMHDLIKHGSTQTWMMNLIRMKPITVIYCNIESQAYEKLFEFIWLDLL